MDNNGRIGGVKPEDYEEPQCLLCDPEDSLNRRIPVSRVIEKLDTYIASRDFGSAERLLVYWRGEAVSIGDKGGLLTVLNEMMGLYRNNGFNDKALEAAEEAVKVLETTDFGGDPSTGTTYLNVGTVYNAAGDPAKALEYYDLAKKIYKETLPQSDYRVSGLSNNRAVALARCGRFEEAREEYKNALRVLRGSKHELLESAVTWLNLAVRAEKELGQEEAAEEIESCLNKAESFLAAVPFELDAYQSFVLKKCEPAFRYYGFFAFADELRERIRKIDEGT
jgi:tetratricopeptide (TPR) repeat protein